MLRYLVLNGFVCRLKLPSFPSLAHIPSFIPVFCPCCFFFDFQFTTWAKIRRADLGRRRLWTPRDRTLRQPLSTPSPMPVSGTTNSSPVKVTLTVLHHPMPLPASPPGQPLCDMALTAFYFADGSKWVYKNKEHGMMSAAASLGLILLWDVDGGLSQVCSKHPTTLFSFQPHPIPTWSDYSTSLSRRTHLCPEISV